MSTPNPHNPYQSPQGYPIAQSPVATPLPPVKQNSLEYLRAYNYFFENPEWTTTMLWGFLVFLVSAFIPGVGILAVLLFLGYMFEVVDALLVSQGRRYPTFDINRFGDYFMRGLWPFLAAMIASLVMFPLIFLLYLVFVAGMIGGASAAGEDAAPFVFLALMALMMVVVLALSIALSLVTVPMILRAGLAQDFAETFRFEWIKDFIRKMWLETLLAGLFLTFSGWVVMLLGMCALCVGMYAAQTLVFMAYAHILYQLYVIYLTRGGAPVPVKVRTMPPPMMPPPQPMG